jgi:hypothetical protein
MLRELAQARVTTPSGVDWHVGRRWLLRRVGVPFSERRERAHDVTGLTWRDGFNQVDGGGTFLIIAAVVAVILVVLPLLLFGIELIIVGVVLAATLLGRVVAKRPWVIEARSLDPWAADRVLEWRVTGWRRSQRLIDEIVSDLATGREPNPALPDHRALPG